MRIIRFGWNVIKDLVREMLFEAVLKERKDFNRQRWGVQGAQGPG